MGKDDLVYELGHWGPRFLLESSARHTDFYCAKCRKEIHGVSMYEHFKTCSPGFVEGLYLSKGLEVGRVKQRGSVDSHLIGDSKETQEGVLLSEPGEVGGVVREVLRDFNIEEAPESGFEGNRDGWVDREGSQT